MEPITIRGPLYGETSRVACEAYQRFYKSNKNLFKTNKSEYFRLAKRYTESVLRSFRQTGLMPSEVEKKLSEGFDEKNTRLSQKDPLEFKREKESYIKHKLQEWVEGKSLDDLLNTTEEKPRKRWLFF